MSEQRRVRRDWGAVNPPVIPPGRISGEDSNDPNRRSSRNAAVARQAAFGRRTMMARDLVEKLGVDPLEALLKMVLQSSALRFEIQTRRSKSSGSVHLSADLARCS